MGEFKFNETIATEEFEKLKIKHKYIIELNQVNSGSVIKACSLLNRLSWAKQDFCNFNEKILLSKNITMKEECAEIFFKLQDKYWKLDDTLSEIKVTVEFN